MTRRELLAGAACALAAKPLLAFKSHITRAHISAITDEIGNTQADAIDFAQHYGLQWVELRNVPETKKEFAFLTEPELKRWATQLAVAKLKVSFLNTSLLKFTWPGLTPAKPRKETDDQRSTREALEQKKWERRREDTAAALRAANILGVDKVRVFTGERVANPETAYPLIVRTMEELIPLAEAARVHLLIEIESTQNIGTSAETKAIMELLPSKTVGINWDPQNALALKEHTYPEVLYVPRTDADMSVFERTQRETTCPYKGVANYFSLKAGADLDDLKLLAQAAYEAWRAQQPDPEDAPAGRGFGARRQGLG